LREKLELHETRAFTKDTSAVEELMELRKYCRQLETQLKFTEFEKQKMTKEIVYMGNKEPTHPIFLETTSSFPVISKKIVKTARLREVKGRSKSRTNISGVRSRGYIEKAIMDSDESAK